MLYLRYRHYKAMEGHALMAYPQECCGVILGRIQEDAQCRATEIYPLHNAWTAQIEAEHEQQLHDEALGRDGGRLSEARPAARLVTKADAAHSACDRFYIDPRDLLKVQKYARNQGWQIIGIYHSHPDQTAEPSERDRQSAWPEYSYIILAVQPDAVTDCRSWRLSHQKQFEPECWKLQHRLEARS